MRVWLEISFSGDAKQMGNAIGVYAAEHPQTKSAIANANAEASRIEDLLMHHSMKA